MALTTSENTCLMKPIVRPAPCLKKIKRPSLTKRLATSGLHGLNFCRDFPGDIRSVPVRPKGGHVRGGRHVWTAYRHHPEGIPDADRPQQWSQSGLQRGAVCL